MHRPIPASRLKSIEQAAARPLNRMSTGGRMLIILGLALLPLGLIALFASRESAHVNRLRHESEARAVAVATAAAIYDRLRPETMALRRAMNELTRTKDGEAATIVADCMTQLRLAQSMEVRTSGLAIYDAGTRRILCATPRFSKLAGYNPTDANSFEVRISGSKRLVRTIVSSNNEYYFGIAEFSAASLLTRLAPVRSDGWGITLRQGAQAIEIAQPDARGPLTQIIKVAAPVAGGQLSLELEVPASPLSPLEILLILLPLLMWAAGTIIGWVVFDRLVLRPLGEMQRAVTNFTEGKGPFLFPKLSTPAHEIRHFGESFIQATKMLTKHEAELATSLANQKRLTREVHHRVKNNLQVVASLISLHSRGAESEAVADAYAQIQRRVDALAVVHRNHYAELEENLGVSMRALIGEITSNLKSSVPSSKSLGISLHLASISASQDVAVPVAFLITEVVELIINCGQGSQIAIDLDPIEGNPTHALLAISSPALTTDPCRAGPTALRFQRIAAGLARQLRSGLLDDIELGRYAITIPILGTAP